MSQLRHDAASLLATKQAGGTEPGSLIRRLGAGFAPAHLLNRLRRLIDEDDAVKAVVELVFAPDERARDAAAERLGLALFRRELRHAVAPSHAKGMAAQLLAEPSIRGRLENTMHLGALHPISFLKATRFDYVGLTLAILLEMKRRYPGIGLGSPVSGWNAPGAPTGLELTQSWAILHSWGHMFGTFATERGLLFTLERDQELDGMLRRQTAPALRESVERVLGSGNLYRAYYGLGAWRASTELEGRVGSCAQEAFRLFFDADEGKSVPMLYRAYKRARQLAYHRLHSYQRLGATCDFSKAADAVRWILAEPELVLDQGVRTPFSELLNYFGLFDVSRAA